VVIGDFIGAQSIVQKNPVTGISLMYRTHDPEKQKTIEDKTCPQKDKRKNRLPKTPLWKKRKKKKKV